MLFNRDFYPGLGGRGRGGVAYVLQDRGLRSWHLGLGSESVIESRVLKHGCSNIVCEESVVRKQHCESFSNGKSWRAKKVLDLVHLNPCGQEIRHPMEEYYLIYRWFQLNNLRLLLARKVPIFFEGFKAIISGEYFISIVGQSITHLNLANLQTSMESTNNSLQLIHSRRMMSAWGKFA